jgi:hypothetical protein
MHRYPEAVSTFEHVVQLHPNDLSLYVSIVRILYLMNRTEEAVSIAEEGLKVARDRHQQTFVTRFEDLLAEHQLESRAPATKGLDGQNPRN